MIRMEQMAVCGRRSIGWQAFLFGPVGGGWLWRHEPSESVAMRMEELQRVIGMVHGGWMAPPLHLQMAQLIRPAASDSQPADLHAGPVAVLSDQSAIACERNGAMYCSVLLACMLCRCNDGCALTRVAVHPTPLAAPASPSATHIRPAARRPPPPSPSVSASAWRPLPHRCSTCTAVIQ